MPKRQLEEYDWLEASLTAFNGSGYADRRSAGQFMDSYLAYQQWKKRPYGITIADKYWGAGLTVAVTLINNSDGPSRVPTYRKLSEFAKYYPAALDDVAMPDEQTATPQLTPDHLGGLACRVCTKSIRNAFKREMICFECWSQRKLSEPQRHFHGIQPPKPKPGGMV
jgi:hypothetical protein